MGPPTAFYKKKTVGFEVAHGLEFFTLSICYVKNQSAYPSPAVATASTKRKFECSNLYASSIAFHQLSPFIQKALKHCQALFSTIST